LKRKIKEEKEKTEVLFKGSQGSGSLKEELQIHHTEGDAFEQESKEMIQSENEEEEEEHKEEDELHEEKSVSTEYEDVENQQEDHEEEEEEEEGYTTRRKHEDLVSNLQDYRKDMEMEKSHEMPSSIGGKEEDSKYDDLFDKDDWLDTGNKRFGIL